MTRLLLLAALCAAGLRAARGDEVLECTFDKPDALASFGTGSTVAAGDTTDLCCDFLQGPAMEAIVLAAEYVLAAAHARAARARPPSRRPLTCPPPLPPARPTHSADLQATLSATLATNATVCRRDIATGCLTALEATLAAYGKAVDAPASCPLDYFTCCSRGLKHVDGSVCCSPECPECGGCGCAGTAPGESLCCKAGIMEAASECSSVLDIGCTCPLASQPPTRSPTDAPVYQNDEMCQTGLLHAAQIDCDCETVKEQYVCCGTECGDCKGVGCSMRGPDCCMEDILDAAVECTSSTQTGCVVDASADWA